MYTVKEAADALGVSPHTIRFYDDQGLAPGSARDASGNRAFDDMAMEWLFVAVTLWRARSTSALDELNRYFTFGGMPVVSSAYWNMMLNSGEDSFGEDVLRQLGENTGQAL